MKTLKLPSQNAKLAIVYRKQTPKALKCAQQIITWCQNNKTQVFTAPDQIALKNTQVLTQKQLTQCHLVVSLGGDGTYLRANRLLEGASVPILGVHLGTLGFLTPTRSNQALEMLKKAFQGELALIPRSMIEIEFKRNKKKIFSALSLNDVVVERGEMSQLIPLSISCGPDWVTDAKADGVVISSPLGSTAYNLAVGGPLLHPESKVFSMSFIAAHALTVRPLVLPDSSLITIRVAKNGAHQKCGRLVVDGRILSTVENQDEVIIKKAKSPHWLVREPHVHEFQILREKLNFGERV